MNQDYVLIMELTALIRAKKYLLFKLNDLLQVTVNQSPVLAEYDRHGRSSRNRQEGYRYSFKLSLASWILM